MHVGMERRSWEVHHERMTPVAMCTGGHQMLSATSAGLGSLPALDVVRWLVYQGMLQLVCGAVVLIYNTKPLALPKNVPRGLTVSHHASLVGATQQGG